MPLFSYNLTWPNCEDGWFIAALKIYFPFEQGDKTAIIENQRAAKIKFKNLTQNYKESLLYMTEQILGDNNINALRKTMRNIDKGV